MISSVSRFDLHCLFFPVCQDFMVREDGALAQRLQDEECEFATLFYICSFSDYDYHGIQIVICFQLSISMAIFNPQSSTISQTINVYN